MPAPGLVRAHQLIELRRFHEALPLLEQLVATGDDDVRVHALIAVSRLGLDDLAGALDAGNAAVRAEPNDEWGHRICAMVLDRMDRHDEAVAAAGTAVRLAPLDWRTHQVYASSAVDARGRGREARAAAERAVQLGPGEPSCHFMLGVVAQRLRDDATARSAYRRTLALDPQHAMAINNLATLDGGFRISDLARRFGSALRHEPGSEVLRGNVAGLAVRFVRRLYYAALAAFVIGLVVSLDDVGTDDVAGEVSPASVLVGVVLLAGIGAYTWSLARAIPPGIRVYVRSRMVADRLLLANILLTVVMVLVTLVVCFVPGGAIVGLVAIRPIAFANLGIFVWTVVRRRG